MEATLWDRCLDRLEGDMPARDFTTWIRPLQAIEGNGGLRLMAPNRFVLDWVNEHLMQQISTVVSQINGDHSYQVVIDVGTHSVEAVATSTDNKQAIDSNKDSAPTRHFSRRDDRGGQTSLSSRLEKDYTFDKFVEGKSNQLARAASCQVAENPGSAYNPLFIYGGVGLGKTHLMHAVGHQMIKDNADSKIVYVHSERFVSDMVKAFQHNSINDFKRHYRSADALLIDDIQFFAKKERSQEEFFHTFNALLEGRNQIIITCDRYPKEVAGLEERLKSRFGWGLTVSIDPPELETCVAILMSKAAQVNVNLPDEVAFFIAKRIRSNVRELEGSLRRVIAYARFKSLPLNLEVTKEALRDLLAMHERLVSIENIQKTVADYYKIRYSDLLSKKRSRSIARPRQIAMSLAKELTNHSLPEIGTAFGGRDHTTVMHACKKIKELSSTDARIEEDYKNLLRMLTN